MPSHSAIDSQSSAGSSKTPSESSKSPSDKRSQAESMQMQDKDRDLSRDNSASPVDLECHIQAERITKIIDEALYKTKLAICLPKLVQNYRILSSVLSPNHMDDLIFIFEQYDNPLFSGSLLNVAALDDLKNGDVSLKQRLNPELGHLLYIMNSYPALKPIVEEMTNKMKEEYLLLGADQDRSPVPILEYLMAFERFRDMMKKQMEMTAAEELAQKLHIRKTEASNARLLAKIQEYEVMLMSEQSRFQDVMTGKQQVVAELEEELKLLNKAADVKIKKKVLDSDRQMVLLSRDHAIRNEMLKEEEVETREGYNNMLHHHLIDEKKQRARRFKVQTQLLQWIQKYDTEMADKQQALNDLEFKYNDEVARIEELTIRLEEQDIEYVPLMKEREDEYQEEMKAKMVAFQLEHAARVIQNAWRKVMANRHEKRKLKAEWKKRKAEIDRLERLADLKMKKEEAARKKAEKQAKKAAKKK